MSAALYGRDGYERFAGLIAVEGDVAAAARLIVRRGWQADADRLADALAEAAAVSAREEQEPAQFAENVDACLVRAGVTRRLAELAFVRAILPDFDDEPVDERIRLAQWRYLLRRDRRR